MDNLLSQNSNGIINITLEMHDDVMATINKIETSALGDINLEIPEGSVLFDNILNLKLLKKEAKNAKRNITFKTEDLLGKKFIALLDDNAATAEGFVTREVNMNEITGGSSSVVRSKKTFKPKMPAIRVLNIKMPQINKFNKKTLLAALLVLGLIGVGLYYFVWSSPMAEVTVVVNSQPLIKSVTVKVGTTLENNPENKTLKGVTVEATSTEKTTADTTGEATVGEKAQGEITVINRTSNDIDLSDGDVVIYKGNEDYEFVLGDDITVPAQTLQDPADPLSPSVPGEAKVEVTATNIGSEYNIDDNETLEVEDYKKSELSAVAEGDFKGGSSKLVKVVAQEDIDKLNEDITEALLNSGEKALKTKVKTPQKLIAGSTSTTVTSSEFNGELGDEQDTLELTQTVLATGLVYSATDLDSILDTLVEDFVPNGFKLSDEDREVTVDVLGNSESTVLSSTTADIQVTLKTYVVPDISKENIINDLAGKRFDEAKKILGSIRNVKTYELKISPNIPFIGRVPSNKENINVDIKLGSK